MKEMVGGCCVCSDERGWPDNPLVYCDGNGCTVAVHQACYGIVTVPTGPWYCRKCESPENKGKVRCELCPSRSGALKRTDTGGWAHVVCALYIPEVRFGNVTSMEPIVLRLIPPERYNKTCYICQDLGKSHRATAGACMQCNKSGCKQQFHVTCAQSLGLLCEEAGNYLDNVKYCGYCQHHYSKLKKGGNVKTIPPYKPVPHDSHSSDSSGEKETESEMAGAGATGGTTPTHATKSKGPGRKSSHGNTSGKNTPASGKQHQAPQPMDVSDDAPDPPVTRKHKNSEKHKKKSPARRGSSTGEGGGSKGSTPAPSPQHSSESPLPAKAVTPAKMSPSESSATVKASEPVGVISSVASAIVTASTSSTTTTSTSVSTSVVQINKTGFQESVITNTDAIDPKQTKKRKAAAAAHAAAAAAHAAANAAANAASDFSGNPSISTGNDTSLSAAQSWDQRDDTQEPVEKIIRRSKSEHDPSPGHFSSMNAAAPMPPPPPAHSPSMQSSRQLPNSLAGPSGMNPPPSTIRSPSHYAGARPERDGQASLLVSVPLPSTPYGINLSTHQQPIQVSQTTDTYMTSTSPMNSSSAPVVSANSHVFYPPQQSNKQVTLESLHGIPPRSPWGGLNVQYEQQHIPQENEPGPNKEPSGAPGMPPRTSPMPPLPPTTIRNKKRAAMSASVSMASQPLAPPTAPILPAAIRTKKLAAMSTITSMAPPPPPPPLTQMASTSTQSLASVRRPQQPTSQPIYTETVKDSPPSSPGERAGKKPELKSSHTAPHMLGNELNPESGVAARLQEQLTAELAAHAAGASGPDPLVPPPLINKAAGGRTSSAQSLDQLLERQWEQGSQFLMEQAQHFDIASLLSCLHQLRTENVRLEDHVATLLQRRDHLLAVNARLAIPLAAAPVPPPPPLEAARCLRENGSQIRAPPPPPPPPVRTETITSAHQSMPDQRPHQRQLRNDERVEERSGLRLPDGVVHLGGHPQRPVNMDAQLMMREVQQKPS